MKGSLYLGVESTKLLDLLEKQNLLGRYIVTNKLNRAYEFGDVVMEFPVELLHPKKVYSTSDENFGFLGELIEEENEYEVKQIPSQKCVQVYYNLEKDEEKPTLITELEKEIKERYNISFRYTVSPYRHMEVPAEELEDLRQQMNELVCLVNAFVDGNILLVPEKR